MKNVTLSADERLVEKAREKARREKRTLNGAFRDWLRRYVGEPDASEGFDKLMRRLSHVRAGRKFTRDEMNER